ncbi:MAG: hypothetical protein Q8P60_02460 [Pseudorhodobacter sp.]|nr:hypothetical protein [Pseudorhodobacter sp.]
MRLSRPAAKVESRQVILRPGGFGRITPAMTRFFDIDDRARLPWRFYGATLSVLARA